MPLRAWRPSLLARFSLLSLLATVVLGTGLALFLRDRVEHRALDTAEQTARVIALGVVADQLTSVDWRGNLLAGRRDELSRVFEGDGLTASGVRRVRVFTTGGELIYATDGRGVGSRAAPGSAAAAALRGATVSEHDDDADDGTAERTIAVALPVPGRGAIAIDLSHERADAAVARDGRDLQIAVAGGLGVLWLLLFRVVGRASRRLRAQAAEMRVQARTDALTGLANRTAFGERGTQALAGLAPGEVAGLMLVDLDHFKQVNDTLGHDQGDQLLREVARRLVPLGAAGDVVARLGGDEFAILTTGSADVDALRRRAAAVREALAEPVALAGLGVRVDASVGIAVHGEHGLDVETLLKHADVAMYAAKPTAERVRVYDPALDPYTQDRLVLATELPEAIARGELVVHFQPIVRAADGRVAGVEALVRWQHPTRGLLGPAEVLPVAESTGAIGLLTRSVLEQAVRQGHRWHEQGHPIEVAVNLASASATDAGLPALVAGALERWPLPPGCLTLELSEDTVITDPRRVADVLERLAELGVRLSLDDFGTGQSSLAYLRRLPLAELKIDRSFVLTLDHRESGVVDAMVALARSFGLDTVAEGVEDERTGQALTRLGCDRLQGYHFGRPMPAAELDRLLACGAPAGGATPLGAFSER
jgi:diguanylate cyclase (GGDEF)-like protein